MTRHAAVDVGSNSIRLLIAEVDRSCRALRIHEDRDVVRLGSSVFRNGRLSTPAMTDALDALERMSIAIRTRRVSSVRAVGTSALRDAANQSRFVRDATAILGFPLEVIDGVEEARLVHSGVRAEWPHDDERLVIVDLGGGSAQLVLSDHGRVADAVSLPIGAVRITEMFDQADRPGTSEILAMRRHVREKLVRVLDRWLPGEVDRVVATSGTARTVVSIVHGVDRSERREADRLSASAPEVAGLLNVFIGTTSEERSRVTGVGKRRSQVLPAGVVVLHEILTGLGAASLYYSAAGLADGIVSELARSERRRAENRADAVAP